MADIETIRTVFQTEWIGGGVVSNMIRQYGLAQRAIDSFNTSSAKGGVAQTAQQLNLGKLATEQARLADLVTKGGISLETAEKQALNFAQSLGVAEQGVGGFAAGLPKVALALGAVGVALGAAAIGFKALYPLLEQGATIGQLDASFKHLVTTMTDYPDVLADMKERSLGTITTMAAQEGVMTLVAGASREMTNELINAAPKLLEISKAANKLNPALGDTNFMFTSLAKGVKRAEPRLIDNLGLKIRIADANRDMAEKLGKSVMALTAEEKQLALLNETLRAGDLLIEQVGGSVEGLGDSFLRAQRATDDWKNSFKQYLSSVLDVSGVNDWWARSLDEMTQNLLHRQTIMEAAQDGLISKASAYIMIQKHINGGHAVEAEQLKEIARIEGIAADGAEKRANINERLIASAERLADLYVGQFSEGDRFAASAQGIAGATPQPTSFGAGGWDDYQKKLAQWKVDLALQEKKSALLEEDAKALQGWADDVNENTKKALEAWRTYTAEMGTLASDLFGADKESSLFTTAIADLGQKFYTTGGATQEVTDEIERLEKKLKTARQNADDFALGIGTVGMKEEAIAKKSEKLTGEIAILEQAIAGIGVAQETTTSVFNEAIWDWKKLEDGLVSATLGAGAGVEDFVKLSTALGQMTEQQALATISATAMKTEMDRIGEGVVLGGIDPSEARQKLENFASWLSNQDLTILLEPKLAEPKLSREDIMDARIEERLYGEEGIAVTVDADTEAARNTLWEQLLGPGAIEPLNVQAEVETTEAGNQVDIFIQEQEGKKIILSVEVAPGKSAYYEDEFTGVSNRRAGGGYIPAGLATLVGEEGPEIIRPGSNSTVTPANQVAGMGAPVINLSISVGGSIGTDQFVSIVEDNLLEAMQRVGLF